MIKQLFLISSLAWCSSVTFYDSLIPIVYNDIQVELPFVGGFNRPKIQWIDWDLDQDLDLFILDASGYLRYMQNQGDISNPDFHLITTFFQNINCGGWFFFHDFDLDDDLELATQNQSNLNNISYYENLNGDLSFTGILADSDGNLVISSSVMTPTFSDIDNDGDVTVTDLIKLVRCSLKQDCGKNSETELLNNKPEYRPGNSRMYYYGRKNWKIGGLHDAVQGDTIIEIKTRMKRTNVRKNEYDLYQLFGYLVDLNHSLIHSKI